MQNINFLELYIHIPYCAKKCKYCDFVSFSIEDEAICNSIDNYVEVLVDEIISKSLLAKDYIVSSIYIGGGTPSLLSVKNIYNIMSNIFKYYRVHKDCEISIESNPNSITKDKLKYYVDMHINRLSIGLQSTDEIDLKTLGRLHTYSDFLKCYGDAVHVGFNNINVDLIYGIPNQTVESLKKSLKQVMMLNPKHLSIYNLIIEEGTEFYKLYNQSKLLLPDETTIEQMDNTIKELTNHYNYYHYEISNYCKGDYFCRHNYGYWSDLPYLGFGLNSSSYFENKRYKNKKDLKSYLALNYKRYLEEQNLNNFYDEIKNLSENDHMSEYFFLSMRKTTGINKQEFFNKFSKTIEEVFELPLLKHLKNEMILKYKDNYYFSEKGMKVSNYILSDFLL